MIWNFVPQNIGNHTYVGQYHFSIIDFPKKMSPALGTDGNKICAVPQVVLILVHIIKSSLSARGYIPFRMAEKLQLPVLIDMVTRIVGGCHRTSLGRYLLQFRSPGIVNIYNISY